VKGFAPYRGNVKSSLWSNGTTDHVFLPDSAVKDIIEVYSTEPSCG